MRAGDCALPEAAFAWKQEQKGKRLLVMLPDNDEICLRQSTVQGAAGCILKNAPPQNFILAVRSVAIGENWFSRRLLQESLQIANLACPVICGVLFVIICVIGTITNCDLICDQTGYC